MNIQGSTRDWAGVMQSIPRLIIHAVNVHQGGGKTLLMALLLAIPKKIICIAHLDRRMTGSFLPPPNSKMKFFSASIFERLWAELRLKIDAKDKDIILCFGNLPPLFRLSGHVQVFIQNRYLIEEVSLKKFPLLVRFRLCIERFWLSAFSANVDAFIVQTPSMRRILVERTKGKVPVYLLPLMPDETNYVRSIQNKDHHEKDQVNFIYVASGEPHKNHHELVSAWRLLAEEQLYPSLSLTLDRMKFPDLCNWIDQQIIQHKLEIINLGSLPQAEVKLLYGRADAMIYPSAFESFGLPLIEARQAGLRILASELDYVRDVIDPEESFDPNSPVSIARAVKRFMRKGERQLCLKNAEGFLDYILKRAI